MADIRNRTAKRRARHVRVRRRFTGTPERPRLAVFKSSKHTYVQVIDDQAGRTLLSVSSVAKDLRDEAKGSKPAEVAKKIGELVASKAKEQGITSVVFDRGGFPYQGRVKVLAEAARAGGLEF